MSMSSIVRGKVSSRKAIIRNEPSESMILVCNRFSSSFTSVMRPAAYSRTNARTLSFTSVTELFVVIFTCYWAGEVLVQQILQGSAAYNDKKRIGAQAPVSNLPLPPSSAFSRFQIKRKRKKG